MGGQQCNAPITPQLLQILLETGAERAGPAAFSAARAATRHLILRWPTLPQMSHVLSRFGQSATECASEPHAWH